MKLKESLNEVNKANNNYKSEIKGLEEEVERERDGFQRFKEESDSDRMQETMELLRQIKELKQELKDTDTEKQTAIQNLEEKIKNLKEISDKEKKELSDELQKAKIQRDVVDHINEQYEKEVKELEKMKREIVGELQAKIDGLEQQLEELKQSQLSSESTARQQIENLSNQFASANTQTTELNGLIKEFEDEKFRLEKQLKEKLKQEKECQENLKRLRAENETAIKNLRQQHKITQDNLTSEVDRLKTRGQMLENQLKQDYDISRSRERSNEELINDFQHKLKESRKKELTDKEKKIVDDLDILLHYFAFFASEEDNAEKVSNVSDQIREFINNNFPSEYDIKDYPNLHSSLGNLTRTKLIEAFSKLEET
jgi:chromosome segregation ATPase